MRKQTHNRGDHVTAKAETGGRGYKPRNASSFLKLLFKVDFDLP